MKSITITILLLLIALLLSPSIQAADPQPVQKSSRLETEHKPAGRTDHGYKPDKARVRQQAKERLDQQDLKRRKKHDIGKKAELWKTLDEGGLAFF